MTTDEKAKAYDMAMEVARKELGVDRKEWEVVDRVLKSIFPELAESEDEIHRKWILEYLYDGLQKSDEQFKDHFKAAIDWLEKQKESLHIPETCKEKADSFTNDERIRKWLVDYFKAVDKAWIHQDISPDQILGWLEKQKDSSEAIEAVERIDNYITEHIAYSWEMDDSNPDKKYYCGVDDTFANIAWILQGVYAKQKEQKPVEKQDYSGLTELEKAIHRGFLCAGVENVPVGIIKDTAKELLELAKKELVSVVSNALMSIGVAEKRLWRKQTKATTTKALLFQLIFLIATTEALVPTRCATASTVLANRRLALILPREHQLQRWRDRNDKKTVQKETRHY